MPFYNDSFLTKKRLLELLAEWPDDCWIWANGSGGLSVLNSDKKYIGRIDLAYSMQCYHDGKPEFK